MTRLIPFLVLVFVSILSACNSDGSGNTTADSQELADTTLPNLDSIYRQPQTPLPTPPRAPMLDSLDEANARKSPFYNIGCCAEKANRKQACCCEEVLKKYMLLQGSNDPKLGELVQKDLILSVCRKAKPFKKAFELIDNPPEEKLY